MNGEAYIIDAVRTPRGRGKPGRGALSGVHPQELLAQALAALVERRGVEPAEVEDVIAGCVTQVGEQGANVARNAVLTAGWPLDVTAVTLNRFCGSGLQAVNFAAMAVASGASRLAIGGGVESMSRIPMGADDPDRDGGNPRLRQRHPPMPQGVSADLIATLEGFSREEVDGFALASQRRTEAATSAHADDSRGGLVPVRDPETGAVLLCADEHPRPETTAAGLAQLPPAFAAAAAEVADPASYGDATFADLACQRYPRLREIRHVHTAGNSSGIVDGAAAVMLASAGHVAERGLRPRARIRAMATAGSDPLLMLTAPAPASRKALAAAGMTVADIDLWEINEAFAVVPLQVIRELELDPERVNVTGGAIARGHPLGATGAMLLGTALDELERRGLATALITLCIRGGQGIATVIERV
jgi:acetyl-CoA C-acetyltransferase